MGDLCVNDDFFSPIRFDSSIVASDEDSDHVFEDNITKNRHQSQLQLNAINGESIVVCTPVSEKRGSGLINAKKMDKTKHKNTKKENTSKDILNVLDYDTPELKTEKKVFRKRSLSLISTPTDSMKPNMKDIKIADKSITHSLKNLCVENKHISSGKYPSGKKPGDNSFAFMNVNVPKYNDALERSEEKNTMQLHHSTRDELNILTADVKMVESTTNNLVSPFEASVEKMVHDCVSSECDKIHRNVYTQQMAFYRQINKIKAEVEQQHSAVNEHLIKVIEELMRINTALKSTH